MSDTTRTKRYRTTDVQSDAGSFRDLLLPDALVQALAAAGFARPSPVQNAAIPIGRVGTDMIVQAKSGTGKTAVFAAVLLERISLEVGTPQALVLAPTRELAIQSHQVIQRVAEGLPEPQPSAAVCVGGLPAADDEKRLRRSCHIVLGTPGRICALVTSGALPLNKMRSFVLDEADELMGGSFYEDITWLIKQLPNRKQVLAFSATYTKELMESLEPFMKRPQRVLLCEETVSLLGIRQYYKMIGTSSSSSSGLTSAILAEAVGSDASLEPSAVECNKQQQQPDEQELLALKVDALLQLLSSVTYHQAVVFCNKKPAAEWLSRRLTVAGCPATCLFADLPQTQRMSAMSAVRGFKVRVIVSTDVLARGVDFDRVNLVVNLDLPADAATYVHRVGRTGRFGTKGVAVAFVTAPELVQLRAYLQDVKGGQVTSLPDKVPEDVYAFDLDSEWEENALKQLLAAPKTDAYSSPPPMHKRHRQQQQQQGKSQDNQQGDLDEPFWVNGRSAWQQQRQQLLLPNSINHAAATSSQAASHYAAAHTEAEYDAAAAWDAWAEYYRSCGYSYPDHNPYRQQASADSSSSSKNTQQQQNGFWRQQPWIEQPPLQQQQEQQQGFNTAVHGDGYSWPQQQWHMPCNQSHQYTGGASSNNSNSGQQQQQQPQHLMQHERADAGPAVATSATADAAGTSAAAAHSPHSSVHVQDEAVSIVQRGTQENHTDVDDESGCEEESDGYEVPIQDDDLDPKAALLLARLHIANDATDAATDIVNSEGHTDATKAPAAEAAGAVGNFKLSDTDTDTCKNPGGPEDNVLQHQTDQQRLTSQQFDSKQYNTNGMAPARTCTVCHDCWAASYGAWRRDYEAWRQQFYGLFK